MKKLTRWLFFLCLTPAMAAPDTGVFRKTCYQHASVSVCVTDIQSGVIVARFNPDLSVTPASAMKLLTTACVLETLGPDTRFETKLEKLGTVTDGVLNGDLVIRGGGDPSLGSKQVGSAQDAFLNDWIRMVQEAGIREIKGRILADARIFGEEPLSPYWLWEDIGNYYAPGIHGLAVFDNAFSLELRSGAVGTRPEMVSITPEIPGLILNNHLLAADNELDSAYFYGAPFQYTRDLFGTMPANRASFTIRGDMPDPPSYLAWRFRNELAKAGITVSGTSSSYRNLNPDDPALTAVGSLLGVSVSRPVSDLVRIVHMKSDNLYTEYLLRQLALRQGILPATSGEGLKIVRDFWRKKGLDMTALSMWDACGLSPNNRVSAYFLAQVLGRMAKGPVAAVFERSLPLAGQEGTVSGFLRGTSLEGKLRLKSGSNQVVNAYAGYYRKGSRTYAVVLLVNHAAVTRFQIREDMAKFLLSL